ncbi:glutathione S-transferase family protein [Aurantivibrio plasticivorans]
MSTIKLYRHPLSGHSHRVELLLSLLNIEAEIIDVDLLNAEHKTPEFLEKNPLGQVPVLEDGDVTIYDSNAILIYLATQYDQDKKWLPSDPVGAALVAQYLSVAAGPVAFGPAAARLITVFGAPLDAQFAIATAKNILTALNNHLAKTKWLAAGHPTIADVANYAYIAHAPEGNVDLSGFPHVKAWLQRVESLTGFVPMQSTAVGLAA